MNLQIKKEIKLKIRSINKMQTWFTDISVYQLSALALFGSPFNSHEWPRQNFSLQYQYNIDQISDKN